MWLENVSYVILNVKVEDLPHINDIQVSQKMVFQVLHCQQTNFLRIPFRRGTSYS